MSTGNLGTQQHIYSMRDGVKNMLTGRYRTQQHIIGVMMDGV